MCVRRLIRDIRTGIAAHLSIGDILHCPDRENHPRRMQSSIIVVDWRTAVARESLFDCT